MTKFAVSLLLALSFISQTAAADPITLTINSKTLGLFSVVCNESTPNNYICQDEVVDLATCATSFAGVLETYYAEQVCRMVTQQSFNPLQFGALKQIFTDLYEGAKNDSSDIQTVMNYVSSFSSDHLNYYRMLSSSMFISSKDDLNEFEAIANMVLSFNGASASFYNYITTPMYSSSKDDMNEIQYLFSLAQETSLRACYSARAANLSSYDKDDLNEVQNIAESCTTP